jgi:CheY-like chemotaxis protein
MRLSLGRLTSFELSRRPISPETMHRIELLQDVREGVERVERIVRELEMFSRADDGPSRTIEIEAVLEAAIALAAHEIRHRARLVRVYEPVPPVTARPADLRQVFLNLLINAVHATPEGEAHVNEIHVKTGTDARGMAIVEIKDSGTGIPAEALPRIFEPFFTTHRGRALGLGLAVTRDLVTALDGQITVDSVAGNGTTIRVALPPSGVRDQPPSTITEEPARRSVRGKKQRILIVDDDRPVAAAIALELGDHDVVVAESGREALEILRHDRDYDMILCDLMMPEVSGMDVYEALRLIDPALLARIVLMTGGAFTRRAGAFLSMVDAPLLEKPFEPGQLHAVVKALDSRREQVEPGMLAADKPWRPTDTSGKDR